MLRSLAAFLLLLTFAALAPIARAQSSLLLPPEVIAQIEQQVGFRVYASLNSSNGVTFYYTDDKTAARYEVKRMGVTFPYPGTAEKKHVDLGGCGFTLVDLGLFAYGADGSIRKAFIPSPPPHSASCNDSNRANEIVTTTAASYNDLVAPGSIITIFGSGMTDRAEAAPQTALPLELAGLYVEVFSNTPLKQALPLFYAGPGQINALLPADMPEGVATLAVINRASGTLRACAFTVIKAAPAIFTANRMGTGAPAGTWTIDGLNFYPLADQDGSALLVPPGAVVTLYLTGLGRAAASEVSVGFNALYGGGVRVAPEYAGPQGGRENPNRLAGLDQVNVKLPAGLSGNVTVQVFTSAGVSQAVTLKIGR